MIPRLRKIDNCKYEMPLDEKRGMRVPGIIYSNETIIKGVENDESLNQVANVAALPGIIKASIAMPDIHLGYGFPIGGIAAFDFNDGIISPASVGYDINCGVRLIKTNLHENEVKPKIRELIDEIFVNVPSGVGREGKIKIGFSKLENFLSEGVNYAVEEGFGWKSDLERIEEGGKLEIADRSKVSSRARERGFPQLGSLGAGNHFLEIQVVDKIFDAELAKKFGIEYEGMVAVMVHTGSRGFGHQVATEYVERASQAMVKYGIKVADKQLAAAPIGSKEGEDYMGAMGAAANFGFSNRQVITKWIRESFEKVMGEKAEDMDMELVYDVAHNIAKREEHIIEGSRKEVMVHRKGATRAFPAGRKEVSALYRETGHPVIIPGTMGTASYVLVGTQKNLGESFGSTCHGSGRVMSRSKAVKQYSEQMVRSSMERKGIYVRAATKYVLQEEVPESYKNVDEVIDSVQCAGISRPVVRLRPIGVMKG
jgi:tRNA-splicing ligase RtcB